MYLFLFLSFYSGVYGKYLLLNSTHLQPLEPRPNHVIDHCDGITAKELGLLVLQVLEKKNDFVSQHEDH